MNKFIHSFIHSFILVQYCWHKTYIRNTFEQTTACTIATSLIHSKTHYVLGMTLHCIHIFIVTGCFLYWCVMRPASQRFFIHSCMYLRILIISYLATFLGTNSLSVLMCSKAINQSINSKTNYCNSLLLNLPATQTYRLQLVLNAAACAVTKTPKFYHNTSILKSLYWLKIG